MRSLIAVLTFIWWFSLGLSNFALPNCIAVLIVACPCALGLATPMSIVVGIGKGAASGVLVRNPEVLQKLRQIDILVIDKTGTLTEGRPEVLSLSTENGFDENKVLRLAASVEQNSEHQIAKGIVRAALKRELSLDKADNFRYSPGKGVYGNVGTTEILLGNQKHMQDNGIPIPSASHPSVNQGTEIFLVIDKIVAGRLLIGDTIKSNAGEALRMVQKRGIHIIVLTGDTEKAAKPICNQLGLVDLKANVLPNEKLSVIKQLQTEGHIVAMAGDGINDAAALAQADVGIAMANGSDITAESADLVLVKGDLQGIERAIGLSNAMSQNIKENLFLAFAYNVIAIPIAAGILYPFGILLNPMIASAAMSLSSVSVIVNALRLNSAKL
jgi:heavy metal translocating P-type ATPase